MVHSFQAPEQNVLQINSVTMSNSIDSQRDTIIDNNNKNYNDELYFATQKTRQNRIFLTALFYVVTTHTKKNLLNDE